MNILFKKMVFLSLCLCFSIVSAVPANAVSHFAFGSCAKERLPQPIWQTIIAQDPELFLFIGDNHYADYWDADGDGKLSSSPVTDPARLTEAYNGLASKSGYQELKRKIPVLPMWDDHDYGANDAGKHYPLKSQSQQAFLDFYGFPENDPIRKREGVYYSKIYSEEGTPRRRVQFIFLDTRYHRDDLLKNPKGRPKNKGPFIPNTDPKASMLGQQQWAWLKTQLQQPAEIRFIISSIQVVAEEHAYETWGNMPLERQRLFDLIKHTNAEGVMFLSGDRHLTEASVATNNTDEVPYPLWDFTASGMTDRERVVQETNRYRKGAVYRGSHFATINIHWADVVSETTIEFNAIKQSGDIINTQIVHLGELSIGY